MSPKPTCFTRPQRSTTGPIPEPSTRATRGTSSRQAVTRSSKGSTGSMTGISADRLAGVWFGTTEEPFLPSASGLDDQLRADLLAETARVQDQVVAIDLARLAVQKVGQEL